ncbi:MAG: capsule assembly Wzi family protein, partial [Candidatus Poribacteria bacterium]
MKSVISAFVLFFLISGICPAKINEPLINSDWVYFALWKLDANELIDDIFISTRPYEREEIAKVISNLIEKIDEGKISPNLDELKLIRKLEKEFVHIPKLTQARLITSAEKMGDSKSSISFWGTINIQPTDYLTLYEEVDVQRGREIKGKEGTTASQRINTWKWNYTADFQKAYVRFHNNRFSALLGRQTLFWGPSKNGSLVLSDNSPSFDMLMLQSKIWNIKFTSFSAVLDKMWNEHGDPPYRYLANRFLSG